MESENPSPHCFTTVQDTTKLKVSPYNSNYNGYQLSHKLLYTQMVCIVALLQQVCIVNISVVTKRNSKSCTVYIPAGFSIVLFHKK